MTFPKGLHKFDVDRAIEAWFAVGRRNKGLAIFLSMASCPHCVRLETMLAQHAGLPLTILQVDGMEFIRKYNAMASSRGEEMLNMRAFPAIMYRSNNGKVAAVVGARPVTDIVKAIQDA